MTPEKEQMNWGCSDRQINGERAVNQELVVILSI